MSFSPERCAAALMGARRVPRMARRALSPLPEGARPTTLAEGVAAQVALQHLAEQGAPAGFKIGATTARMQDYLGLNGPAAGFMGRDGLHASGSTLSFAPFLHPGVECELAVHLQADIAPGLCSTDQAAAAVDLLMVGIEVVENRYADLQAFGTPSLLADQVFHAAAVLGQPIAEWKELDLARLRGEVLVDGVVMGTGVGGDLLGHPMQALAWLAASAEAAAFGGLRAGQIVMLGSVTPPIWLQEPCEVMVRFPPLPEATLRFV